MFSDIVDALDFEANSPKGKFLLTLKDNRSDLGFVFGEIISNLLKKNYVLVIVNFAQSFHHFNQLLSKYGVNVKSLREANKLLVVDVLSEVKQLINPSTGLLDEHCLGSIATDSTENQSLKLLYKRIENSVNKLCSVSSAGSDGYILFIDEINVLLNLGYEIRTIQPFLQYCQALCLLVTPVPGVLLVGGTRVHEDEENKILTNFLSHMADTVIEVEALATGYSTVAHGKISMKIKDKIAGKCTSKKFLFKVEDKGAKLLPL